MKQSAILLLVPILALAGCSKPAANSAEENELPPPAPVVSSTPETTKNAAPVATAATPLPDPLAPAGVFYLLSPASVMTDDGIIGLKPGTQLQQTALGTYTDAAGHSVKLADTQVTNNLRLAGLAARADAASQAALQQAIAQRHASLTAPRAASAASSALITSSLSQRTALNTTSSDAHSVLSHPQPDSHSVLEKPAVAVPSSTALSNPGAKPVFTSGSLGATHSSDHTKVLKDGWGNYWLDSKGTKHYLN